MTGAATPGTPTRAAPCLERNELAAVRRSLLAWYRSNARDLPWRRTRDPYHIWLSEVLLQQTRVETVIAYYERFVAAFPTVVDLAAASLDEVMHLWQGLGYYARARNMHRAAQLVDRLHAGKFPSDVATLRTLPGVGRYTAGAVASIACGRRAPVLDGNVKRVLARLLAMCDFVDDEPVVERLWQIAEALLPRAGVGDFNQGLMELGAVVCTPKKPACGTCPLHRHCRARINGCQAQLPRRRPRRAVPHVDRVAAAVQEGRRYLLVKRPERGLLAGLWELPGRDLAGSTDSHEQHLAGALRLTCGQDVEVGPLLGSVSHVFTHRTMTVHVYSCTLLRGSGGAETARPTPEAQQCRWATRREMESLAFSSFARKMLALLG